MHAIDIIKHPILTEKGTKQSEQNKYLFEVDRLARKDEIKRAVEELYRVKVTGVNTVTRRDANRRTRWGVVEGKTSKKAIVTLREGDAIELF